jgi:hypothetical protein
MSRDHYVPQFLLKKFSVSAKNDQVFAYDKWEDTEFPTNVGNICSENDYNYIEVETIIEKLETPTKIIIDKILKEKNLNSLTKEEKDTLKSFSIVQLYRTRKFRESLKQQMFQELDDEILAKDITSKIIKDHTEIAKFLDNKDWFLYENPHEESFYCSDNPVILSNSGAERELGLNTLGVEISLPISPKYRLSFVCSSIKSEFEQRWLKIEADQNKLLAMKTMELRGHLIDDDKSPEYKKVSAAVAIHKLNFDRVSTGEPFVIEEESLLFYNSIQVRESERFIISSVKDFSLARKFLNEFPHRRNKPI